MSVHNEYRNLPFYSESLSQADLYIHRNISDLLVKCEEQKETVLHCRTVGILESLNGRFHLQDLDSKDSKIRVSMANMKSPLPSTVIPFVVQIFGVMQWTTKPVLFATLIQVLNTANGVRLNEALKSTTNCHLADQLDNSSGNNDKANIC